MTKYAIQVEDLSKEYIIGGAEQRHDSFREMLTGALTAPIRKLRKLGGTASEEERFWALEDVSFNVEQGQVLGIIGRNGAGKSTLLKILSRITAPSRGKIEVRGRLASLLEVGTGFHPELSGRENIFLNATILGMGKREIANTFDQIVEFSGVERFLDTPVKRYSSGMYLRLAFAVAAHVDADILLVDEVLAVGDAEFQKRCLGMMSEVARGGRTVLFVSHNLNALSNLCTEGLLLNEGRVESFGPIGEVLNQYTVRTTQQNANSIEVKSADPDKVAILRRVAVVAADDSEDLPLTVATPFKIVTHIEVRRPNTEISVFVSCFDSSQNRVFSSGSFFTPALNGAKLGVGLHSFSCDVSENLLNSGEYTLDVSLLRNRSEIVLTATTVVSFHIHDGALGIEGWHWPIKGIVRPDLNWTAMPITAAMLNERLEFGQKN